LNLEPETLNILQIGWISLNPLHVSRGETVLVIRARIPKSEIRNPKSEIRNPQSEIRNPQSEIPIRFLLNENPLNELPNSACFLRVYCGDQQQIKKVIINK